MNETKIYSLKVQMKYNEPMCLLCCLDYGPFQDLFYGPFVKKLFFRKEEFSNEILQVVTYYIYSCPSNSHFSKKSNLDKYEFF
jgi:hypothetical protein